MTAVPPYLELRETHCAGLLLVGGPGAQVQEAGGPRVPRLHHRETAGGGLRGRRCELNRRFSPDVYLGVARAGACRTGPREPIVVDAPDARGPAAGDPGPSRGVDVRRRPATRWPACWPRRTPPAGRRGRDRRRGLGWPGCGRGGSTASSRCARITAVARSTRSTAVDEVERLVAPLPGRPAGRCSDQRVARRVRGRRARRPDGRRRVLPPRRAAGPGLPRVRRPAPLPRPARRRLLPGHGPGAARRAGPRRALPRLVRRVLRRPRATGPGAPLHRLPGLRPGQGGVPARRRRASTTAEAGRCLRSPWRATWRPARSAGARRRAAGRGQDDARARTWPTGSGWCCSAPTGSARSSPASTPTAPAGGDVRRRGSTRPTPHAAHLRASCCAGPGVLLGARGVGRAGRDLEPTEENGGPPGGWRRALVRTWSSCAAPPARRGPRADRGAHQRAGRRLRRRRRRGDEAPRGGGPVAGGPRRRHLRPGRRVGRERRGSGASVRRRPPARAAPAPYLRDA